MFQFGGAEQDSSEFKFPTVHRSNVEAKERPHQPVISPTPHSSHGSSGLDTMDVLLLGDDIVNQIPLLVPLVHPCGLVSVCQSEGYVCDGKVIFSTYCK